MSSKTFSVVTENPNLSAHPRSISGAPKESVILAEWTFKKKHGKRIIPMVPLNIKITPTRAINNPKNSNIDTTHAMIKHD